MIQFNYKKLVGLILFSIPSTLLNIGILFILNIFFTAKAENIPDYILPVFFLFIVYSYLINILFQAKLVKFNYSMVYNNEVQVLKILHSKTLAVFEKYGPEKFYNILEDLRVFVFFPTVLTSTFNAVLTMLICLGYLFWKSTITTIILIAFIFLFIAFYFFINRRLAKKYEQLRQFNEEYYRFIDDSIKGFKEFKISARKTYNFFNKYLIPNRKLAENTDVKLATRYLLVNMVSQYAIYILLGFVLLMVTYLKILDREEVASYVIALLFLNGPISSIIAMQSFYVKARVSRKRIKTFFKDFDHVPLSDSKSSTGTTSFKRLAFENVSFRYNKDNTEGFTLENIQLKIYAGDVLFIVGGNGSGKSTFINILTGLYQPDGGQIYLNDEPIKDSEHFYKELFSVIHTDNYLFSKNYEDYILEGNEKYASLLKIMKMDAVVDDDDDASVRRKFSKGQSKRLAMIFALLEDKPILVLDEWAADQDPHFRKYFYETLVPHLRKEGKTIIAITHDDAYFKYADRIVKFDYGHIVKDVRTKENSLANLI